MAWQEHHYIPIFRHKLENLKRHDMCYVKKINILGVYKGFHPLQSWLLCDTLPSHKLSGGRNAAPIKVPIVAPIVAITNNNGECRNTAKFIKEEATKFCTAHTCPIESAIPIPT